ncbi:MAG: cytochrome c-type biogenesis protein CcmH [Endozoicomonas sp. (ex Botrylloides leachii)]|nr:cytochrome c-type biogenesis protein CcmH [Endozoicomonas sp. (ex Botrylloides leachii)]
MSLKNSLLTLLIWLIWPPVFAVIDVYRFDNAAQEQRFSLLTHQLRCPKCQNQSIADSDAPIANDLRQAVYQMLLAGKDNQTIIDFMLARYGQFVLYRPPLVSKTVLLWMGPSVFLLIGLFILFLIVRRHQQVVESDADKKENAYHLPSKEE